MNTLNSMQRVNSFLKWAGGKRWLIQRGLPEPKSYTRFVEPFAGSASVFFALQPPQAILADKNEDLINLFCAMRDRPIELQNIMALHHEKHCAEYYYEQRDTEHEDSLLRAARILYLNRTCWNGLYRVNKLGKFNVPKGSKSNVLFPDEDFLVYSRILHRAQIICQDFENTISNCARGDFIFVDPPYTVKHNNNGFLKYNEDIFNWNDQIRLLHCLESAADRGAAILVTNADHNSLIDIYSRSFEYKSVKRESVLSGNSRHRGQTTEAVFTRNMGSLI